MNRSGKTGLTALELKVMQVIWRRSASTVAEVQAELDPPLAYTTVQTMPRILERKRKVDRGLVGRAYVYRARESASSALGRAMSNLVERMFGGSSEELVISLVKTNQLDAAKLAEFSRRLQDEEKYQRRR